MALTVFPVAWHQRDATLQAYQGHSRLIAILVFDRGGVPGFFSLGGFWYRGASVIRSRAPLGPSLGLCLEGPMMARGGGGEAFSYELGTPVHIPF